MPLGLSQGDSYGDFEIHRRLRVTDRFEVYEATERSTVRRVQLKLAADPVESEDAARRALRELAVLGELTNTHVQRLYDSGLGSDERWFLVLEHLDGTVLDRWHDLDRPMDAASAIGFVHQACLGLAELHAQGVVHRDLEPAALWVEHDGNLKILDFSSARSWDASSGTGDAVTATHGLAGSPQYAAPETALADQLSPTADVYAIGQILYELLSGRVPFWSNEPRSQVVRRLKVEPVEWMRAHARDRVIPLSELVSTPALVIPPELDALVLRMLAKDPSQRPESAGVVANELGWLLHHVVAAAPTATVLVTEPDGGIQYHLLTPGSHRVGFGAGCDIALRKVGSDEAIALVEWQGQGRDAEVRALADGRVEHNGVAVSGRATVAASDSLVVEGFSLAINYPK